MELLFQWGWMLGLFWPTSAEDRQSVLAGWVSQDDGTFLHFKHSYNTHAGRSLFNFLQCLDQHRTRPAPSTGSRCLFFFLQRAFGRIGIIDGYWTHPVIKLCQKKCSFPSRTPQIVILASFLTHKHTHTHKTPSELHSPLHLEKKQ